MPEDLPFPIPSVPQPAAPQQPVNNVVQPTEPKKSSKFGIFIGVLIFITLVIYGGVTYLYLGNKQLEQKKSQASAVSPTPQVTVNPDKFTPDQVQILNGSVYRVKPSGDKILLVNKDDYKDSTGITGFVSVKVSPDNNKMCFVSLSPAPKPALYYANIDGSGVLLASGNKSNCFWSNDSKELIYVNTPTGTQSQDIYVYKLDNNQESNLTLGSATAGSLRNYSVTGLSTDGSEVLCSYEEFSATASAKTKTNGTCQINLSSGEIINL